MICLYEVNTSKYVLDLWSGDHTGGSHDGLLFCILGREKGSVKRAVLIAKFTQNRVLKEKLVQTGSAQLIEANTWGDQIWGVDKVTGQGQNLLGKCLMDVRSLLQSESS